MMLVTYLNSHGAARAGVMIDNGARIADLAALGAAVHGPGSRDFGSVLSIIEGRPTTLGVPIACWKAPTTVRPLLMTARFCWRRSISSADARLPVF